MASVVRLATSQERKPIRACETCRYFKRDSSDVTGWHECAATSQKAYFARTDECNGGEMWEAKPPPIPAIIRLKRWLIG